MAVNTGYVSAGLKTRNEVRADLGLPPLPGGDAALVTTGTGLVGIGAEVAKYDPNQPRNSAGNGIISGRWTVNDSHAQDGQSASRVSTTVPTSLDDLVYHPGSGNSDAQVTLVGTSAEANDRAQNAEYTIRAKILQLARSYVGSKEWADDIDNGVIPAGKDKCNLFVYQVLTDAGATPGTPNGTIFHVYPPTAGQWADLSYNISGWYVLGPKDTPEPGDVVAQKMKYIGATGHVMIVGPNGTVIGTGPDNGTIEQIPMPAKLGPVPIAPMVFRRWKSSQ